MHNIAQDWLNQQPQRRALFTDIDNTLVRRGTQYAEAAKHIREYTTTQHIPLILVTGLSANQVLARIEAGEIPQPEAICGSVGTEIWLRTHDNIWQKDTAYNSWLAAIGFNATTVQKQASMFIATASQHDFVFQPQHAQNRYKVSLHFMATPKQAIDLQQKAAAYFAPFKVVVCKDITAVLPPGSERQKFCMDILPATKGDAVAYLTRQLDIQGGWKAGDSGNDLEMLLHKDSLTPILVGGYTEEAGQVMLAGAHHKKDSIFKLSNGHKAYIETSSQKAGESILQALQILK
jgi:hydroxymethylpyrimidine pyrophosphatase-like HAD family hydrolase